MGIDFWLCDLETALADLREYYGHLGLVADRVLHIPNGFAVFLSSGEVVMWDKTTRKIEIDEGDWRSK